MSRRKSQVKRAAGLPTLSFARRNGSVGRGDLSSTSRGLDRKASDTRPCLRELVGDLHEGQMSGDPDRVERRPGASGPRLNSSWMGRLFPFFFFFFFFSFFFFSFFFFFFFLFSFFFFVFFFFLVFFFSFFFFFFVFVFLFFFFFFFFFYFFIFSFVFLFFFFLFFCLFVCVIFLFFFFFFFCFFVFFFFLCCFFFFRAWTEVDGNPPFAMKSPRGSGCGPAENRGRGRLAATRFRGRNAVAISRPAAGRTSREPKPRILTSSNSPASRPGVPPLARIPA